MNYKTHDAVDGFLDAVNLFGGAALAIQVEGTWSAAIASIIAGGGFYRSINRKDKEVVE